MRTKVKKSINNHPLLWTIIYFLIYLISFFMLEQRNNIAYHILDTKLDYKIPFIEQFIIPYFLWYGYVGWTFIYMYLKDKESYKNLCFFIFGGMTIFVIISTIFPNAQGLRPIYLYKTNVCTRLVNYLYHIDTSTNVFPSIHVYNSIGCFLAIYKSKKFVNKPIIKSLFGVLTISIVCSTMFLKQHTIYDVLGAIVMAIIMYSIVYKHTKKQASANWQNCHF